MTSAAMVERARIPGWFNHGAKILDLVEQHRPKVCVELGTWQGASAIPVARSIARWGGTLTCVDTWSGDLNDDGGSPAGKHPIMLMGCAREIVDAGVGANVRLIPAMTGDAATFWSEPIDFLYVDADHSYEGVMADLVDEHPRYPGVKQAWDEFEQIHGLTLTHYQSTPPMQGGVQIVYGTKP